MDIITLILIAMDITHLLNTIDKLITKITNSEQTYDIITLNIYITDIISSVDRVYDIRPEMLHKLNIILDILYSISKRL